MQIEAIREALLDRRLTIVAQATGLSYNTVKKVADGHDDVTLATLRKLAEYLDIRG